MKKIINKNDLILIGVLLVGAILIAGALFMTRKQGKTVVVSVDSKEVASFPLDKDVEYEIEGYEGGRNFLVIKDGIAYMSDASCPDHLCMHMGQIKDAGQSIICLPNRVVIEIKGGKPDQEEYDTLSS